MTRLETAEIRSLRRALLAWYEDAKRPLPWRATSDPYAIWLSEAMLQQTRVETVIDYWHRFLEAFPNVADLADADEEQVVALWSGLGYYRRARQLHAAARHVRDELGGEFPTTAKELLALPGVGRYTAGAVASIAFDRPEPLVDGNVLRVFSRWFALEPAPGTKELENRLWDLAEQLVPRRGAGTWNQALMELGATLCTPRNPACPRCPVRAHCAAHRTDRVAGYPRPKVRKKEPVPVELTILVVESERGLLLEQRAPDAARMPGLWEFPTYETTATGLFPTRPTPDPFAEDRDLGELRHGITHHRIRAIVRAARLKSGTPAGRFSWRTPDGLVQLGLTGMARKVLRKGLCDTRA